MSIAVGTGPAFPFPWRSPLSSRSLRVRFIPEAYGLVEVEEVPLFREAPARHRIGVYLWCIALGDQYLVNYAGKTSAQGGFLRRLGRELRDWEAGRHVGPVDIESFKRGCRVEVQIPDPVARERQLARQREEIGPLYRILLAPLEDDPECCHVEDTIVHRIRQSPAAYQFISNRDRHTKYRPAEEPTVEFESELPIIGLSAPIPTARSEG